MPIALAVLGVLLGLAFDRHGGWLYAGMAGLALGLLFVTRRRLTRLEGVVERLRGELAVLSPARPVDAATARNNQDDAVTAQEPAVDAVFGEAAVRAEATATTEPTPAGRWDEPAEGAGNGVPGWRDKAVQRARDWLLGGNLMVRAGVVILFFGVAFLLKFAADNALLPIELRLAGVAAAGIAMLLLGWRLREKRRAYGLVLQGGAVGVLYLTVFAALRLYDLLPPAMAFAVLVLFAALSAALAVLQNAQALAVLGAAGGFLAPVLASTGEGSHVQLFSYYLVLNLGILGIAWFRAWRSLNLVGFFFTFGIASLWGSRFYRPEFFSSTEPFLIAFVLMYVAITVLFAFRQPLRLRGYVDATLVFGVPLVGFALQAALVRDMEYYLAWSALAAAGFYLLLARLLYRRLGDESRLLAEAFLAVGVVFATLAVPLALDARWTAGMWALEGAAMVWVGGRQQRAAARWFGYLLQLGAGLAFLHAAEHTGSHLPPLNGIIVGALIIALAGLFTALHLHRHGAGGRWEGYLRRPFFAWGLVWWYGAWLFQIADQVPERYWVLALGLAAAATGFAAERLRARLDWPDMSLPAFALLPSLYLLLPLSALLLDHPFEHWAWGAWLLGLMAHLRIMTGVPASARGFQLWHGAGLWLALILLSWEAAWLLDEAVRGADTWWRIAWGLVPAAALVLLGRYRGTLPRPLSDQRELYLDKALRPVGFYLWAWLLVLCLGSRGAADPLPYLPLLNPMDIAVGLVALALLRWLYPLAEESGRRAWRFDFAPWTFALTLFVWLNSAWFRTAHHGLQVGFSADAMFGSQVVQAGLSLLWGLSGLAAMLLGARMERRRLWFVGAGLMAVVVLKLFVVDLSNTGTMARIVSFLSVGGLLLVVGYFAPIPPRREEATDES